MSTYTDAGHCVRIAQAKTQMSTKQLCEKMGVARQQMHRWQHSKNLKLHTVEQLAQVFGMELQDFCSLDKSTFARVHAEAEKKGGRVVEMIVPITLQNEGRYKPKG